MNTQRLVIYGGILVLAIVATVSAVTLSNNVSNSEPENMATSSVDNNNNTIPPIPSESANEVTYVAKLFETKTYFKTEIKPSAVLEDSRCPSDVQCIQAGRVRVALELTDTDGSHSLVLEPGKPILSRDLEFTLFGVTPNTISTHKITDGEYRFTIKIVNKKEEAIN